MRRNVIFLLIGVVALILSRPTYSDTYIRVRPNVFVTPNSPVKLSQLVDIQGVPKELQAKMAEISVSVAPLEGERQEINDENIMSVLRPLIQSERSKSSNRIQLIVPKVITLLTSRGVMTKDLIATELLQAWRPLCSACQLEISNLIVPQIQNLKNVQDWSLNIKSELPKGTFTIPVQVIRTDGSSSTLWVNGRLTTKRRVPVANRILQFNDRVAPTDFNWEYRDTSYALDGVPTSEEIVGHKLRQGLRVDEILWKNMLERERAVRRGDLVQIRSTSGAWEITMNAIAQQDGFVGDTINLKNPRSNTVLVGQVIGQGEVDLR